MDGTSAYSLATSLTGLTVSSLAWGNYNGDTDLDLLVSGSETPVDQSYVDVYTQIYRRTSGSTFVDIHAGLELLAGGDVKWGDFDHDGDQDLIVMGDNIPGTKTILYENQNGTFVEYPAGLPPLYWGSATWFNFDGDNDEDLILTGAIPSSPSDQIIARIYENVDGTFVDIGAGLTGVVLGGAAAADYDGDGLLDVIIVGETNPYGSDAPATRLYKNMGGNTFQYQPMALHDVSNGDVAWGDVNGDTYPDLLISGYDLGAGLYTGVFLNDAGTGFTELPTSLEASGNGAADWGDFDGDGDLDILLAGESFGPDPTFTRIYRNNGDLTFTDIGAGLPGISYGDAAWADYDGDGDLDVALAGEPGYVPSAYYFRVYRNDGGSTFTKVRDFIGLTAAALDWGQLDPDQDYDIAVMGQTVTIPAGYTPLVTTLYRKGTGDSFSDTFPGFANTSFGEVAWGDYDNDADLDVLVTGWTFRGDTTLVYRYDGGGDFNDSGAQFPWLYWSAAAWGDYDNDGDLDLALCGGIHNTVNAGSWIYRNDGGGAFTDISAGLTGVALGCMAWADYDGDGKLDLLVSGETDPDPSTGDAPVTKLYRNMGGGSFSEVTTPFEPVSYSAAAWGDYDNDGHLDLLLQGYGVSGNGASFAGVYHNNGNGTFTDIGAGLPASGNGGAEWGDYDNDGDPDILLGGELSPSRTAIFENNGGVFTEVATPFPGIWYGDVAFGDYDGDHDLDVALSGEQGCDPCPYYLNIYRNDASQPNTPPTAPSDLAVTVEGDQVTFYWSPSTDAETPAAGLSYNLRVGTTPGGCEIVSPMARADGLRTVVGLGNAQENTKWTLTLPPGTYYWSVQAIDACWEGSPFAPEDAFGVVSFAPSTNTLANVVDGACAWGDFDADGDLDLLLTGSTTDLPYSPVLRLYTNDGSGALATSDPGIPAVADGALAWSDWDRDGDLDVLVTGEAAGGPMTALYEWNGTVFLDAGLVPPGLRASAAAWADFNHDGREDFVIAGLLPGTPDQAITRIYLNDGHGGIMLSPVALPGVVHGSLACGDVNGDGYTDLLITGETNPAATTADAPISRVYLNDGAGGFTDMAAGLEGVSHGSAVLGDYDDDGRLDILIAGENVGSGRFAAIYHNTGAGFADVGAGLEPCSASHVAWGDFDNDGDLDALVAGDAAGGPTLRIYQYGPNGFSDVLAGLPGWKRGPIALGDFDADGDLDLVATGETGPATFTTTLLESDGAPPNAVPSAPSALQTAVNGHDATLSWASGSDAETATGGLSYNVRLGTASQGIDALSPMSLATGERMVVATGNAGPNRSMKLTLDPGTYWWSVQSVDHGHVGSGFSSQGKIYVVGYQALPPAIPGGGFGSAAWADYNKDGRLDLVLTGSTTSPALTPQSLLYENLGGGAFAEHDPGLTGVVRSAVAWWDYDKDAGGFPDLLLAGDTGSGPVSTLYHNDDGSTFTPTADPIVAVSKSACAWGDFDRNGACDFVIAGLVSGPARVTRLYRNLNPGFEALTPTGFVGVSDGALAWADFDRDAQHLPDLLIAGDDGAGGIAELCRNEGDGVFSVYPAGFTGVTRCAIAWGNYDSDAWTDVVIAGRSTGGLVTTLYHNDDGTGFTPAGAMLPGVEYGSLAWGDFDNDGDQDLLLSGATDSGLLTDVFRNEGAGVFVAANLGLPGISHGAATFQDFDGDKDLDIFIAGESATGPIARVYEAIGVPPNTSPGPPGGLTATITREPLTEPARSAPARVATPAAAQGAQLTLSWGAGSDGETPEAGLLYNVRVGTAPGLDDVVTPMSDLTTGKRRIPNSGNAEGAMAMTFLLPAGAYYWSVQTIDGAYSASPFANEQSTDVSLDVGDAPPPELRLVLLSANPSAHGARLRLTLPSRMRVHASVHDIAGRRVATLLDDIAGPGNWDLTWDAIRGRAPGVYLVRVDAGDASLTRRVVLLDAVR